MVSKLHLMDSSNIIHTLEEEGNVRDFHSMFNRMMDVLCEKIEDYPCDMADVDKMYHSYVRSKAIKYKTLGITSVSDVVRFNINRFSIVVHWSVDE